MPFYVKFEEQYLIPPEHLNEGYHSSLQVWSTVSHIPPEQWKERYHSSLQVWKTMSHIPPEHWKYCYHSHRNCSRTYHQNTGNEHYHSSLQVCNTVSHIPPEHWKEGGNSRTVKHDVYSFAILLWELATGKQAYKSGIWRLCSVTLFISEPVPLTLLISQVVSISTLCVESSLRYFMRYYVLLYTVIHKTRQYIFGHYSN